MHSSAVITIARPTRTGNTGEDKLNKVKKASASRPLAASTAKSVRFLSTLSASQPPKGENTMLGK